MAEQQQANWTYNAEDGTYDVSKMGEAALAAFPLLVEVSAELQNLSKRSAVLNAASIHLNSIMRDNITDEAKVDGDSGDDAEETA